MGNQNDLFDGLNSAAAEAGKPAGEGKDAPERSAAGGGSGALPPNFAPLQGEYGDSLPLGRYASTQYLQYAIATVKDRALPRVGDGQKPVQARILYSMWDSGTRAGTKRTKSAAVVGEVLKSYHPHGDQRVAHVEVLREADERVVRRHVAVRMVVADDLADDLRALAIGAVRGEAHLPHRVENAAMRRLEAVADVRKRAPDDHAHCVIEIRAAHLVFDVDGNSLFCAHAGIVKPALSEKPQRLRDSELFVVLSDLRDLSWL
jgi:hypothetical protein